MARPRVVKAGGIRSLTLQRLSLPDATIQRIAHMVGEQASTANAIDVFEKLCQHGLFEHAILVLHGILNYGSSSAVREPIHRHEVVVGCRVERLGDRERLIVVTRDGNSYCYEVTDYYIVACPTPAGGGGNG